MPQYRAKEKGFWNGELYGPDTKRPIVITDSPLKPIPKWLEPMKNESRSAASQAKADADYKKAQKKLKEAKEAEKKAAKLKNQADAAVSKDKKKDDAMFTDIPEKGSDDSGIVETL